MEEQWLTKRWQEPDVAGMHILIVSDKPHIWVDLFFLFFLHLFFFSFQTKRKQFFYWDIYTPQVAMHTKRSRPKEACRLSVSRARRTETKRGRVQRSVAPCSGGGSSRGGGVSTPCNASLPTFHQQCGGGGKIRHLPAGVAPNIRTTGTLFTSLSLNGE